ncbi:MAG TPA: hypothetical protein VFV75_15995 [Candidatus Polarisedimenticolaceae bacterium]|nr:hypothetical protein [Candidatus Polarisedimenticolaceae bacterium]
MQRIERLLASLNAADVRYVIIGATAFAAHGWSRRIQQNLGDVAAPFASLDDLIAMKRAAGRRKDLEDLHELERIKQARD